MNITDLIRVQKAQLWEEAKGKLRAMVLVEGQVPSVGYQDNIERYREAEKVIEKFIENFEDNGLHE